MGALLDEAPLAGGGVGKGGGRQAYGGALTSIFSSHLSPTKQKRPEA